MISAFIKVLRSLFILGMTLLVIGCSNKDSFQGKNVIVLLVDTLRQDHLGVYGSTKGLSPSLDRLARRGFYFRNAYAPCSWTKPSVASLMTGLYPGHHGVIAGPDYFEDGACSMDLEQVTLAERLKSEGYRTAAFINNPHILAIYDFDQGFDAFTQPAGRANALLTSALAWKDNLKKGEKFFLYLHLIDPHAPYFAPEAFKDKHERGDPGYRAMFANAGNPHGIQFWLRQYTHSKAALTGEPFKFDYSKIRSDMKEHFENLSQEQIDNAISLDFTGMEDPELLKRIDYLISLYEGEVAYVDDSIGRFIEALEKDGTLDDTILIVTSDHGEAFLEHGLWGHGKDVHAEKMDIPLILYLPKAKGPIQGLSDTPASLVDLYPTLLEMLELSPSRSFDGQSLWPVIQDPNRKIKKMRPLLSETIIATGDYLGMVMDGIKVMRNTTVEGEPLWQYFDIEKDPREERPLDPEEAGEMGKVLKEAIMNYVETRTTDLDWDADRKPLTAEEIQQMKDLGYL